MFRLLGGRVRIAAAAPSARQLLASTAPARSLHMLIGGAGTLLASPSLCGRVGGGARCHSTQSSGIGPMSTARLTTRLFGAHRRRLCTTPHTSRLDHAKQSLQWLQQNKVLVGVAAGAVLVMYGFYRISIRVMSFFLHVPPQKIFTAGMAVGAVTTVRLPSPPISSRRGARRLLLCRSPAAFLFAHFRLAKPRMRAPPEPASPSGKPSPCLASRREGGTFLPQPTATTHARPSPCPPSRRPPPRLACAPAGGICSFMPQPTAILHYYSPTAYCRRGLAML